MMVILVGGGWMDTNPNITVKVEFFGHCPNQSIPTKFRIILAGSHRTIRPCIIVVVISLIIVEGVRTSVRATALMRLVQVYQWDVVDFNRIYLGALSISGHVRRGLRRRDRRILY
jgi:hypothetical protein